MRSLLRRYQFDALLIIGLFLLPLAFFWQVTLADRTLLPADNLYEFQPFKAYREAAGAPEIAHNGLLSDLVLENYAWKLFIRESLSNGEIPLWNPYSFAGVPFLAAGQHSALYPFSLIYYVVPLEKAYGWFTVSQLWLAGALMYLFMRGLGVGRFGVVVSAVAYQMSAMFLANVVFPMIIAAAAWLPFLLLMVEFTIQQKPFFGKPTVIPWVALGAVALGVMIFAGHVEYLYYELLVMGFWAAWRLLTLGRAENLRAWIALRIKPAAALLALVILGMGIGAVQFIPLVELAGKNFREGRTDFDTVRSYAFPARHALVFLLPNIYGSPAQHEYYDVFSGQTRAVDWQVRDTHITNTQWPGGKNYVEGACYVGLLTLILAVIALLHARFERSEVVKFTTTAPYRAMFATLAVISLTFVFGTLTYAVLYYGLPGISQLHSPFRWVFPLTLCLAALAGYGAEVVQRSVYDRSSFTFRAVRNIGLAVSGLGGLVLIGLVISRLAFTTLRGPLEALFHRMAGADYVFPNVETFYSASFTPVLIFGLFLLASGLALLLTRVKFALPRQLGSLPLWQIAIVVVLALDLVVATAGFNPSADPKWLQYKPPAITWLKQHNPQEWRFISVEQSTHTMNANVGLLYGLNDVVGYDSMIPKQYVEYMRGIQDQGMLIYNRIAPIYWDKLDALTSPLLNALGVKYIVSEVPIDAQYGLTQVYQDNAVYIYENPNAQPRVITTDPNAEAHIAAASGIQVMLDVNVKADGSDGKVVLHDSYFPGWRAYIRPQGTGEDAEHEVAVELYDGNFRAVQLPSTAGDYTIRMRYAPPSFQIGAFTSFIAGVVLLFAVMVWIWQSLYTESADASGNVRRFAKNSLAPIVLNLFNRGIDFAFAAIMLRILGPANAGTYYYAVVIFGWFDTLTNFGLNLLLTREVSRDRSGAGRYLLNSSVLRLGLACAGIPVLILFLFINNLFDPLDQVTVITVLLLYVGLLPNSISYGLTALFYAFEQAELPAAISTVSAILKAVFGLAALLLGWGVIGLAGVSILLNLITLTILSIQSRRLLRGQQAPRAKVERPLMREMLSIGWPLMLNNLLAGMFFKIDVTLLEPMKGRDVVGTYGVAYKWVDALGVIPSLFTMAMLPIMSRLAKEDKPALTRNYFFAVKLLVTLALPVAVMITVLAYPLIGILGGSQYLPDGAIALQLMIWFVPIGWINSLTNYVLVALDEQHAMRWVFGAGVLFNIVANLLFIPAFSYRASAIITILSEVVLLIGFARLLKRSIGAVNWVGLLWKLFASAAVMIAVMWVLAPISMLLSITVGVVTYPVMLLALRPFTAAELTRFAPLLPSPLRKLIRLPVAT